MIINFPISKKYNKYFELQLEFEKEFYSWFYFNIAWTRKVDHAGFMMVIEFLHLNFNFEIYDSRHWDDDNDCWEKYK